MDRSPAELLSRAQRFLGDELWTTDFSGRGFPGRLLGLLQLGVLIGRGFVNDKLLLRASALTYMTSLAIVPLLVVALSVIDWLGLSHDLVVLIAEQFLAGSPDAVDSIMALVEKAKIGAFGSIGGAIFLVTTLLSLRNVERTLDDIWGAEHGRSWVRRLTNYLALTVAVPVAMGVIVSLAGSLAQVAPTESLGAVPMGDLVKDFALGLGPLVFLFGTFTAGYFLLPNTLVRLPSAAIGGGVAALLFSAAQYIYVTFSVGVARYDALFGGFAILPLLLVWIYVSWSVVLLGSEIAYAHQHLDRYRRERRDAELEPAQREVVGLRVIVDLARAFRDGWPPQSAERLAQSMESSLRTVSELLGRFERAGLVTRCGGEESQVRFQLGRAAESVSVGEVLEALRGHRLATPAGQLAGAEQAGQGVDAVLRQVDETLQDVDQALAPIRERSLADLLASLPHQDPPGSAS